VARETLQRGKRDVRNVERSTFQTWQVRPYKCGKIDVYLILYLPDSFLPRPWDLKEKQGYL
jgi:hypothetical protein